MICSRPKVFDLISPSHTKGDLPTLRAPSKMSGCATGADFRPAVSDGRPTQGSKADGPGDTQIKGAFRWAGVVFRSYSDTHRAVGIKIALGGRRVASGWRGRPARPGEYCRRGLAPDTNSAAPGPRTRAPIALDIDCGYRIPAAFNIAGGTLGWGAYGVFLPGGHSAADTPSGPVTNVGPVFGKKDIRWPTNLAG